MRSTVLTFIVLLMVGSAAMAQDYTFRVLANKGQNQYKSGGSEWQSLRTGATLKDGDEVQVAAGAYIGLIHKTGKTLELKKEGTFKVNDLAGQLKGGTGVINKYADFVMNKMSEDGRRQNRLAATGAVERATGDNNAISVFIPSSVDVFNSEAIIQWAGEDDKKYKVTLKNIFDDVLMEAETSDSQFAVDFDDSKIASEKLVIFNVSLADDNDVKSGDYGLKRISNEDATAFSGELTELQSNLEGESSLNMLILAEFFEQNNLLADAVTSYVKAISMSPDVEYFAEAFQEFKVRNNLNQ